ncbi:MAG: DUF4870 domain-containing protein [Verrucomicrobiota bacterium]|nr:DUF4870 domain-containing protein [Verrucomicrobiota bacterium]MEC8189943.1 DUF4870 domain-containing protein [Verrucomicrobiota bacterium]
METSIETSSSQQAPRYTTGIFCHLLGLASYLGIPFGNIIAPLVLWLLKRADDPFVDVCGKEAVNFQITISLYFTLSVVLIFAKIGILLLPLVVILHVIYTIVASIKASEGQHFRYPLTIRFLR